MNLNFLKNKNLLITGGTGSFGKAFISFILKNKVAVKKIIVYSRDELKQFEFQNEVIDSRLQFLLGDVRDYQRLLQIMRGVDFVNYCVYSLMCFS
jgi:UDP-N-acetylglucosamine 4,6-dehydratase